MTTDTLQVAKAELWEAMKGKGTDCPCCGRFAKLYPYRISRAQVHAFAWIAKNTPPRGFINVQENAPRWILQSNSHGKLVHWSLLQTRVNEDNSKKDAGMWGVTDFGRKWIAGHVTIRAIALVFDNKCHGHRGEVLKYSDVFSPFHYGELMESTANEVTP